MRSIADDLRKGSKLEPGTEVLHEQLGKGTVVFDKPHCIQVRFIMHGTWNFTQEEWASGRVSRERLRGIHSLGGSSITNLEYALEQMVENGDLSEEEALKLLARDAHPMELTSYLSRDINRAYRILQRHPKDPEVQDDFYKTLIGYITTVVKSRSGDGSTFSNVEDAIPITAARVWGSLSRYDEKRSSFARFVSVITEGEINRLYHSYKANRISIEDAFALKAGGLSPDERTLLQDWIAKLDPTDRTIVQYIRDGLTQEEIAEALNISQSAVSQRLTRLQNNTARPF